MNQDERRLAGGPSKSPALATEHKDVTLAEPAGLGGDVPTPELSSKIEKGMWPPRMRPDRDLLDLSFDEAGPNEAKTGTLVPDRNEVRSALRRSVATAEWRDKRCPVSKSQTQPQAYPAWIPEALGTLTIKVADGWSSVDLREPDNNSAGDSDLTGATASLGEPK